MAAAFSLQAIDGANPLGFLAALGTLRLASLHWPQSDITLGWQRTGRWTPKLLGVPASNEESFCTDLLAAPWAPAGEFTSALGKNLTVSPDRFRRFAETARESASLDNRALADFAAAFGCEDCVDDKNNRIRYTQLCFITGSGHQDFLGTVESLKEVVTAHHLYEALFGGWQGRNKGLAFRWDPLDAREYALRWSDPGKEGAWSTWGVNRLALEALPFFPTQPGPRELFTTGFTSRRQSGSPRKDEFSWPIWADPLGIDEVRSLLAHSDLQNDKPTSEDSTALGIQQIFRATRVRIGQGANFKVSFRPPRSV